MSHIAHDVNYYGDVSDILTIFFLMIPPPPTSTLFPYTTLFRSVYLLPLRHPVLVARQLSDIDQLAGDERSEEHTSELQSLRHLVCRLLLEKKNNAERRRSPTTYGCEASRVVTTGAELRLIQRVA